MTHSGDFANEAKLLPKAAVMDAIRELGEKQLDALRTAFRITNEQLVEGEDAAEDAIQFRVHIAMARSRDALYFERGISEQDIDFSVKELKLEDQSAYNQMVSAHESEMKQLLEHHYSAS